MKFQSDLCMIEVTDEAVTIKTWGKLGREGWSNVLLQCVMSIVAEDPQVNKEEISEILKNIGGYKNAQ